jgi:hypothetical protein
MHTGEDQPADQARARPATRPGTDASTTPRHDPAPPPCERCGQPWQCGMGGHGPCACTSVQLSAATLARLRSQYSHCLCLNCLQALALGESLARGLPPGA